MHAFLSSLARGTAALSLGAMTACSGTSHVTRTDDVGRQDASVGGADAGPTQPNDPSKLEVSLEPALAEVCPGKCITLAAHVADASANDVYSWSDDASLSAESREVCPSSTTTYRVEVDRPAAPSVEFELEASHGEASRSVSVRDDCIDGQLPPVRSGPGCAYRIPVDLPSKGNVSFGGLTELDALDNLYLAATLTGWAHLGEQTLGSDTILDHGNIDLLLAKFDSSCKLQWARLLEADGPFVSLLDFAVDPEGNLALLTQDRSYDLWFDPHSHDHLYKLDTQGNLLWDIPEEFGGWNAMREALAFADDGSLAVRGMPTPCAGATGYGDCVAVLDKAGATRWTVRFDSISLGSAFDSAGNLAVTGMAGTPAEWPTAYASVVDKTGVVRWQRTTPIAPDNLSSAEADRPIFTSGGDLLSHWLSVDPAGQHLHTWRLDAEGNAAAEQDLIVGLAPQWLAGLVALSDATFAALSIEPPLAGKSPAQTLEAAVLVQLGADGTRLSELDVSTGPYNSFGQISARRDGALSFVVVESAAYTEQNAGTGAQTALVVHRHPGFATK